MASEPTRALPLALSICLMGMISALSAPAEASPWVLPDGVTVLQMSSGFEGASKEYLPDGTLQAFPLRGRFESYFLQLRGRHGLGKDFEITAQLLFKGIHYASDPLLMADSNALSLREARENILAFDQRAQGLADINLGLSYQHLAGALHLASNIDVKLPSGYRQPQGTFEEGSQNIIGDDVTLGDGQMDIQYTLFTGWFLPSTSTLIESSVGYKLRLGSPGDQILGGVKLGQSLGERFFVFGGTRGVYTLFEGEPIGEGLIAKDPDISALDFTADNVKTINLTLDKDAVTAEAGVILRLQNREWIIQASRVLYGKNYPQLTGVSVGAILVFD